MHSVNYDRPAPRKAFNAITDKQIAFIDKLAAEGRDLSAMDPVLRIALNHYTEISSSAASELIESLLACPKPVKAGAVTETGMYTKDGEIYKVQKSKESGRLYAKQLTSNGFVFAAGVVAKLSASDRMSLEEAKEYGLKYGVCCVCGALLTDPKSISAGIGPICAGRV